MNWLKKLLELLKPKPKPLPPIPNPEPPDSNISVALLIEHNRVRALYGKNPLVYHEKATQQAQNHSDNMAYSNNLTHDGFMRRAHEAGFSNSGENVAWNQDTIQEVIESWMGSQGHRANILNNQFKYFGGGRAQARDGSYYWCTLFGA